ncbi:hypothetical protein KR038_002983, partial [Drosophila bunnanda]
MSQAEKMQGQEHDDEQSSDIEESGDGVERDDQTDDDDNYNEEDSNGDMQQEQSDNGQDGQNGGQSGDEQQGNGNNSQQQMDRSSATNLIINYLPQDMSDRELFNLFSGCGPINTCKIMRDFKTGYSFGYGFVDYKSESDSEDAIQKLNGFYVRNKRLKVSYARPGGMAIKDTNLYVINLPRNINDDMLDRIFSPYGRIVQRNILRDKLTGRPRGVAFVRYNKREEAQEAIKSLNNTVPEGGQQPIWVRLAEEHGKAKAAQFMSQIGGGGGGGGMNGPPHMGGGGGGPLQPPHHHNNNNHHNNPHMQPHYHQQPQQHPHQHHHPPMHHQQQQQHHHHHQQHHQNHHHNNHNNHHNMGPHPHHMQQMHQMNLGMGMGVGMGMGMGGMPMHGGGGGGGVGGGNGGNGGGGGGGGGGFHHMAHRG